jgi:hypothetical protein
MDENAARIQTVSSVPCPHGAHVDSPYASRRGSYVYDGVVCLRTESGQWWQVAKLHDPLMCGGTTEVCFEDTLGNQCHGNLDAGLDWIDGDTPGAVPHTKPDTGPVDRVTGTMRSYAQEAHHNLLGYYMPHDAMKAVIEAALAAQDTGDTAEECAHCKGKGRYWEIQEYEDQGHWITCPPCRGTGGTP